MFSFVTGRVARYLLAPVPFQFAAQAPRVLPTDRLHECFDIACGPRAAIRPRAREPQAGLRQCDDREYRGTGDPALKHTIHITLSHRARRATEPMAKFPREMRVVTKATGVRDFAKRLACT